MNRASLPTSGDARARRLPAGLLPAGLLALVTLAGACSSGGGGSSKSSSDSPGLAGEISVLAPIAENEPNDNLANPQALGDLQPGGTLTVVGEIGSGDTIDAYRVNAPERVKVVASLLFEVGAGPADQDLDLAVFDPVGSQQVETFESASVPEQGSFEAKGAFVIEVLPFAGGGVYTLTLDAVPIVDAIAEREPNTTSAQAQYVGELLVDDTLVITGSANSASDGSERFLVACPESVVLDLSLAFPSVAADYDLRIYDASTDAGNPTLVGTFEEGPGVNPEVGQVTVATMALVQIEVFAFDGSGEWTLTVQGQEPPPTPQGGASIGTQRGGHLAFVEYEGRKARALNGRSFAKPVRTNQVFGELIVRPKQGRDLTERLERRGMRVLGRMPNGTVRVGFDLPAGLGDDDRSRFTLGAGYSLDACGEVEWATPNEIWQTCQTEPNDAYYPVQWHYSQIGLPATWDLTTGVDDIIVAVLDTGETAHPDLVDRQIAGVDMIADPANAGDGDGYDLDPTDIGDNSDGHAGPGPSSFHGTHVAGTIGATTNNGTGVAGVNWNVRLMHVRVLGLQGGTNWDIAQGILYAAGIANDSGFLPAEPARVINMSLGGPGDPDLPSVTKDAIDAAYAAGVVIIAAAGNNNSSDDFTPASYPNVISVSAVDLVSEKAPYSNFHPTVDIAAPGGDVSVDRNGDGNPDGVLSTLVRDDVNPPVATYGFYQGTSMAAPHVAGVAALMLAANGALTPANIESFLTQTATDLGTAGRDDIYGYGLVNAFAAVSLALNGAPTDPVLGLSSQSLAFDSNDVSRSVTVSNFGAGVLNVAAPLASTDDGGNWLFATRVTETPGDSDTEAITVSVDRTGLTDGTYTGSVALTSNGGNATISVTMLVSSTTGGASLDIFVLVIDPVTFDTIAEATLNTTDDLDYRFTNLAPGEYYIVAGSDVDLDNFICDDGEPFCGAYPSLDQPGLLVLEEGDSLMRDLDFPVQSVFKALSSAPSQGFQRLGH